jgi:hypothetical protein
LALVSIGHCCHRRGFFTDSTRRVTPAIIIIDNTTMNARPIFFPLDSLQRYSFLFHGILMIHCLMIHDSLSYYARSFLRKNDGVPSVEQVPNVRGQRAISNHWLALTTSAPSALTSCARTSNTCANCKLEAGQESKESPQER